MISIIVDIDGTIADCSHRRKYLEETPKNWKAFFEAMKDDEPILPLRDLLRNLNDDVSVILCTGRPREYQKVTEEWLHKFAFRYQYLYMRETGDFRPDHVVKKEMLHRIRGCGHKVLLAIDDRQSVVDLWRSEGLVCLQNKDEVF